jgi:hypothetical protein
LKARIDRREVRAIVDCAEGFREFAFEGVRIFSLQSLHARPKLRVKFCRLKFGPQSRIIGFADTSTRTNPE